MKRFLKALVFWSAIVAMCVGVVMIAVWLFNLPRG